MTDAPVASGEEAVSRGAAAMTLLTAVSRATGFVRILVVAAVLGTGSALGNTYQTVNSVPNLLFELLAAGALQAALIPTLVDVLDREGREEAGRVAGAVTGLAAVALAALAAVAVVLGPWLLRAVFAGVDDPAQRAEQVRLGTLFLLWFAPQVVFYAAGAVATAVLNAQGRFAAAAFAPVVNNVVVVGAYLLFAALRDGSAPSLDLTSTEVAVLAGGTTLAVVAFCTVPIVAAARAGVSLRPRLDHRHPAVRRIARTGAWAALYLALTQVLLVAVLVLANAVDGGVVAYQVAFTFFLLPHALFAVPILTALYPTLSRRVQAGERAGAADAVGSGLRAIAFFVVPATAALAATADLLADVALVGDAAEAGADLVAGAIVAFAPGLVGYGGFLFLTRAFYAAGDARTPALVNAAVAAGGTAAMATGAAFVGNRVAGVAAGHSVAYLAGALALLVLLRRRLPVTLSSLVRPLAVTAAAGVVCAAAMVGVVRTTATLPAVVQLALAGAVGGGVYLGLQRAAGTPLPTPARLRRTRSAGA